MRPASLLLRRARLSTFLSPFLLFGMVMPGTAQDTTGVADSVGERTVVLDPALTPGTPIMVRMVGAERASYGRFVDVDPGVLRLRSERSGVVLSVPVQEIDELGEQVLPPDRDRAALRGGLYGAGGALLFGLFLQTLPSETANLGLSSGIALMIPAGMVGMLIGRMAAKGVYEPVSLRVEAAPPRPALAASDSGAGADPEALARFGELVEGTWESADSRHIYEWTVGREALRSRSYFPDGDGWQLVSEGFWYEGEDGDVRGVVVAVGMPFERMEYETRIERGRVIHDLRTYGGEAVERWVETWRFTDGQYAWTLERRTGQGLEQIMAGEYQRVQQ